MISVDLFPLAKDVQSNKQRSKSRLLLSQLSCELKLSIGFLKHVEFQKRKNRI